MSRRGAQPLGAAPPVRGVTLIPEERLLLKDGQQVPLTPKAFDLLVVLAASPGRLLTKEHLLDAVWPATAVEESQTNDRFVFGSGGGASGVYRQAVDGERYLLFRTGRAEAPTRGSPDGRLLLYTTLSDKGTGADVWVRTGEGTSAVARPLLQRERDQGQALLSPEQRRIAHVSNETGPNEVFVAGFGLDAAAHTASAAEDIQISDEGGFSPRWRRDGRELFYLAPDGSVMAIEVGPTGEFRPGAARRLFTVPSVLPEWGAAPDGTRFLFAVPVSPPPPFTVVHEWQTLLSP